MSYEIEGKLIVKGDIQNISDSFKKREFVIEIVESNGDKTWVKQVKLQLINDKTSIIDSFNVGDKINANFNIDGKGYEKNGKTNYFNNLTAWKVDRANENKPTQDNSAADDGGNLPF